MVTEDMAKLKTKKKLKARQEHPEKFMSDVAVTFPAWASFLFVSSGVSSGATVGVRHKAVPRSSRIGLSRSGERMPLIRLPKNAV